MIFFEPKATYRAFREEVPDEEETMPLGKSVKVREGKDLTMISYGAMMRPTLEAAESLKEEDGVEAEVIDLGESQALLTGTELRQDLAPR